MAEFLIRVKDKRNFDDAHKDLRNTKRGDVIVACPDGWQWSHKEKSLDFWRIIKVPGMDMAEAETYCQREPGDRKVNPVLQRRYFKVDIDHTSFPKSFVDYIADDSRAVDSIEITVKEARDRKVLKPPLEDPLAVG